MITALNEVLKSSDKAETSLIELKKLAVNMLPRDSSLRALILSEPDYLPKHDTMVMIDVFAKLLWQEVKG